MDNQDQGQGTFIGSSETTNVQDGDVSVNFAETVNAEVASVDTAETVNAEVASVDTAEAVNAEVASVDMAETVNAEVVNISGAVLGTMNVEGATISGAVVETINVHQHHHQAQTQHTPEQIRSFEEGFRRKILERSKRQTKGGVTSSFKDENLVEPNREFTPQIKEIKFYKGGWKHGEQLARQEYRREGMFTTSGGERGGREISKEDFAGSVHHRNRVIIGEAGSGKTTVMKRLARDVLDGSMPIQVGANDQNKDPQELIHFLNIRDIPVLEKTTPHDLFFKKVVPSLKPEELEYGFEWVKRNQKKVVFFLDGLDQAPWSLADAKHNKMGYLDEESTATIMYNIFTGHLFPDIQIILSSREHAIARLTGDLRPNMVAALAGFTLEDRKDLFIQLAGDNGEDLWKRLCTESPNLVPLCSVPIFDVFTVIIYKNNPDNPPDTMTGIITKILQIFIRSKHFNEEKREEIISKLKKMAYNGTKEGRVLFKIKELNEFGLILKSVQDLVVLVPGSAIFSQCLMEGDYNLFFCHQSIQELLSSLYIVEMDLDDFKQFLSNEAGKEHWSVVFRFLCGVLLNDQTYQDASGDLISVSDLEEKQTLLKKNLRSRRKNNIELFACLYEAKDLDLIQLIVRGEVEFNNFSFTPNQMLALSSVLRRCKQVDVLQLWNCDLKPEILDILQTGLGSSVKIRKLDIAGNKDIGENGYGCIGEITKESKVEELVMAECNITAEGLRRFHDALIGAKIRELNIWGNKDIGEDGCGCIGEITKESKVEELVMAECDITAEGLRRFHDALNGAKIRTLYIWGNKDIGEDGCGCIGEITKDSRVEELGMAECDITAEGLRRFHDALNGAKIRKLDIAEHKDIGEDGCGCIGEITKESKVEELVMTRCNITAEGFRRFHDALNGAKIKKLDLSCNYLDTNPPTCSMGDDGIQILAQLVEQRQIEEELDVRSYLTEHQKSVLREAAATTEMKLEM